MAQIGHYDSGRLIDDDLELVLVEKYPGDPAINHLIEKLNRGLRQGCKLTFISALAEFGKTTPVSEWAGNLRWTNDNL